MKDRAYPENNELLRVEFAKIRNNRQFQNAVRIALKNLKHKQRTER